MTFDFHQYITDFNAACGCDEESMVNRYFTEDLLLEGPDRTLLGRQHWAALLMFAHDGVSERLEVLRVVREGECMMAELEGRLVFSKDRSDHPMGPAKAGQEIVTRFFASYEIRGDRISRLLLAWWPAQAKAIHPAA
ncbi:MAG: hypothetical protein L6Q74_05475 [Sphaerotilus natans subsp. sulfidivorans]|uniref:hypothetical protein n=1 Tax=Sphaerotilus sulfidivorans TaxID=639200 RepID=UPI002354FEC5|nr:hypothetical protein [Sphaerotilus sulfidivorans]MCK6401350.1 hypothetical protein [Sphaerotilus sulfidivorans]